MSRHQDFQRIYDEFCFYYHDERIGEQEYYGWLKDVSCDESRPYGSARESFKWAKTMLSLLREDADNKYYGVIVGLPWRSMNGNVYKERDLIAAALSLKGKHPSLNHKDEFWFNESNRYGVLTVVDAKYDDGAVEAVLKVPKTAVCPICNGAKMTKLIDEKHIVNISLEGNNNGAFEFTDPPFTLLTSDVLPGIPLARIKPLEQIVSEAYNHSHKRQENKKRMVIKAKILESDPAPNIKDDNSTVNTNTLTTDLRGTFGTPITSDKALYTNTMSSGNTTVPMGESPANKVFTNAEAALPSDAAEPTGNSCPTGTKFNPETGQCEPTADPKLQTDAETESKTKEDSAPTYTVDAPLVGPSRNTPPDRGSQVPKAGKLPNSDSSAYWAGKAPAEPQVMTGTRPPLEHLEDKVARIKAESKAKTSEAQAVEWEMQFRQTVEESMRKEGQINELKQMIEQANTRMETALKDMNCAYLERDQYKDMRNQATGERDETRLKYEKLVTENKIVNEKYQKQLDISMGLSNKVTKANEDYIEVAQKLSATEEALGRARNEAKRITKILA